MYIRSITVTSLHLHSLGYIHLQLIWFQSFSCFLNIFSQYIEIGIAQRYNAGLRAGLSGFRIPARAGNFYFHRLVQNGSGAHPPPIQWVPGAFSLGIKRPGREVDHSPTSSDEDKNAWSYTSTPPVRIHGLVLSWSTRITAFFRNTLMKGSCSMSQYFEGYCTTPLFET
jgi:hypothetical protein